MSEFLARLFDTTGFVPRRQCGHWSEELVRLHVGSDLAIWLAYMAIPAVLVFFVRRRLDVPFSWMFWMFGAFIVSCGFTHLMEVIAGDTSIGHATAYCHAIEALAECEAPLRAQALRAIASELERLANHVGDLGALAKLVGLSFPRS